MTGTALAKPIRAIRELKPAELLVRAVQRAQEIREAAIARVDAEFAERMKEAMKIVSNNEQPEGTPEAPNGAASTPPPAV